MPELPEVETVKNGLSPFMSGRTIDLVMLHREGLRVPFPINLSERVKGRKIERLERRAKYLLIHIEGGLVMVVHLGMSGQMTARGDVTGYEPLKHDHMVIYLSGDGAVILNDVRRFGMVYLMTEEEVPLHPAFKDLGPEPLSNEFSAPVLGMRIKGKKTPIKIALLDQHVVAGVGNIYASEALHQSGISPERAASSLKKAELEKLVPAIRDVLTKAIRAGGSTLKDYRQSDGTIGYFQHNFTVYDREGESCPICAKNGKKGHLIQKIVQGGRATYYCPKCQK